MAVKRTAVCDLCDRETPHNLRNYLSTKLTEYTEVFVCRECRTRLFPLLSKLGIEQEHDAYITSATSYVIKSKKQPCTPPQIDTVHQAECFHCKEYAHLKLVPRYNMRGKIDSWHYQCACHRD